MEIEEMPYPEIAAGIKAAMENEEGGAHSVGVFGLPEGGAKDIRVMLAVPVLMVRKVGDTVIAFGLTESGARCVLDGLIAAMKMTQAPEATQIQ